MDIHTKKVVVFDSGIGGLTVLSACRTLLPSVNYFYYGDNANAPYGNKTNKEIQTLVFNAFKEIAKVRPDIAVIGCNTATAVCVEGLRKVYPFPIVGAEPAILPAAKEGGKIYVLTTSATAKSGRLNRLTDRAKTCYPNSEIVICPCEGLAGAIERNCGVTDFDYSPYLPAGNPRSVVLGCTHYIYIKEQIRKHYGVDVYDGNLGIARRVYILLGAESGQNGYAQSGQISFLGAEKEHNANTYKQMFGRFL